MRLIIGGLDPPLGVCVTRGTQCTSFCWNDSLGRPRCTALPCVLSCPDKNTSVWEPSGPATQRDALRAHKEEPRLRPPETNHPSLPPRREMITHRVWSVVALQASKPLNTRQQVIHAPLHLCAVATCSTRGRCVAYTFHTNTETKDDYRLP